jgi:4-amino-4-deoxy-L-arabinose transferase-like glycosyltransferase
MHDLWGDEAETALFARNIIKYGIPKGWDGVNIMGIDNAVVLNDSLVNHTSPWAQYYLTAISFRLFGESIFTARLPFIVLSVASLILLYWLGYLLVPKTGFGFAITGVIIAVSSVQWILFSYQTRYYAVTIFCSLLLTICALQMQKKWKYRILFVGSGILFFYSHYVSFVAYYVSLFFAYLLFWVRTKKERIQTFKLWVVLSIVITLCTLPWIIILKPMGSRGGVTIPSFYEIAINALLSWKDAYVPFHDSNMIPIGILLLCFGVFCGIIIYRFVNKSKEIAKHPLRLGLFLFFLFSMYLFLMAFFTAIITVDTTFVASRYTVAIFPICFLFVSWGIVGLFRIHPIIASVVFVVFLTTNLFSFRVNPLSFPLLLVQEMISRYPTPARKVAEYLQMNAKKGDTVFVTLDRDHEPLLFFLGDYVQFVDRINVVNTRVFPKNRDSIPRPIYANLSPPNWIIQYGKRGNDGTFFTFDDRPIPPYINLKTEYEQTIIPLFFSDLTRPEIERRSFVPITPQTKDMVYIYKRIR